VSDPTQLDPTHHEPAPGTPGAIETPDAETPLAAGTPDADVLDTLGAEITDPDTVAEDAARARIGMTRVTALGRLGELALWWAAVRGDPAAAAPSRVLHVGSAAATAALWPGLTLVELPRAASVDDAIGWGVATADDAADRGVELIALSLDDPGATRALSADLMGLDPVEASGWPADREMSDQEWMDAVVELRDRLRHTRGLRGRPADLLRGLGSPATAAAAALVVQATARRTPLLLDGPGAASAALLARRTAYQATAWWQAAHLGDDALHQRILGSLGLTPLTELHLLAEDGTAIVAALALLDVAAGLLADDA
jgi:nicotinate-nucleotide--dimethylbenzimidazole phosphoribosyltransferase